MTARVFRVNPDSVGLFGRSRCSAGAIGYASNVSEMRHAGSFAGRPRRPRYDIIWCVCGETSTGRVGRGLPIRALGPKAGAVKGQGVPPDAELVDLADHVAHALETRIAEFQDVIAVFTNEVVVLPVAVSLLVFGVLAAELMPHNEIAVDQQLEGVVNGRPADRHVAVAETGVQLIRVEMPFGRVDLVEDREPLWCLPLFPLSQKPLEQGADIAI